MNTIILIGTIVITLIFFMAGLAKIYKSFGPEEQKTVWTPGKTVMFARLIASAEIIAALLFSIPYYFLGFSFLAHLGALMMIVLIMGAPISHIKMGENNEAAITTLLLILVVLITFLRIFG